MFAKSQPEGLAFCVIASFEWLGYGWLAWSLLPPSIAAVAEEQFFSSAGSLSAFYYFFKRDAQRHLFFLAIVSSAFTQNSLASAQVVGYSYGVQRPSGGSLLRVSLGG